MGCPCPANDLVSENLFFQHKTTKQLGCQIDYLVQTTFGSLYICEIKFSKHPVGYRVVEAVQEKIKNLKCPKHFSCRPVLIHVNGVQESVIDSNYFSNIIDFSQVLCSL